MDTHNHGSNGAKSVNILSSMLACFIFGGGATSTPDASTWPLSITIPSMRSVVRSHHESQRSVSSTVRRRYSVYVSFSSSGTCVQTAPCTVEGTLQASTLAPRHSISGL